MCECSEALLCGMQGGEWKELQVMVPRECGPAAAQCQQPLPSAAATAQGFITGDVCKLKLMVTWWPSDWGMPYPSECFCLFKKQMMPQWGMGV